MENLLKASWADEVEKYLEKKTTLPPPKTEEIGNYKIVTEYRWNKDGKIEKVVRTYEVEKRLVSKAIVERKTWAKFGDSRNDKPGPNIATTIPAEEIQMQFLTVDGNEIKENPLDEEKKIKVNIKCRTCSGKHWTSSCQFKDTGLVVQDKKLVEEIIDTDSKTSTNKPYIPPAAREGATNTTGKIDPYSRGYGEVHSIRIGNLPESTSKDDLSELVNKFGAFTRISLLCDKSGICKGSGYVDFKSKVDAERAIKRLHGYGYDHMILIVDWAPNYEK